jgi:methionine sulfoxide reductase heme-binding subunit
MIAAAAHGPSVLWYAARAAGAVSLVLLTAAVALGVAETRMWRPRGTSRFAMTALHRSVSLLALAFLALHVATIVLDPFPRIGVLNATVPFATTYRALWVGLGTVACDLMLAVVLTSLVRRRLGYRAWRGVHWLAYASWPLALVHGFGAGSDARATWLLVLSAACVAAVMAAVAARLAHRAVGARVRTGGAALLVAGAVALIAWLAGGPLASGWARRAGTPRTVLAAFSARPAIRRAPADPLRRPFTAGLSGTVASGLSADGTGVVDLSLGLRSGPDGRLRIRLGGQTLPGGGLHMERSAVTLGPPGDPARYRGRIDFLQGGELHALVGGAGRAIRLRLTLSLGADTATGRLDATPVAPGAG